MPQSTVLFNNGNNKSATRLHSQIISLDSRNDDQVVSDKKYLKILQLSDLLSRHLDVETIITTFCKEIQSYVAHDGYRFVSEDLSNPISKGNVNCHSLAYQMRFKEQDIGEIVVYRKKRFSTNEVCQYEDLLCALVHPLRNGLMYSLAIQSAYQDPLTGLSNRRSMEEYLPREICLSKRYDRTMALLIMDLDGFKKINDELGHDIGDRVLQLVGKELTHAVRNTDLLFRYGGDEFVSGLPQTDVQGALDVAERIRDGISHIDLSDCESAERINVSIGISMLQAGDDFKRIFKRADKALYKAKDSGKNCIKVG